MFKNKWVRWGIVIAFLAVAVYSLTMNQQTFEEKSTNQRATYKKNLLAMENSPVANLADFKDFKYFYANERFVVIADFQEGISTEKLSLTMTNGSTEALEMAGVATFELLGKLHKLMLFDEGETFMLPFFDLTNGKETYSGGRYINVEKTNTNRLTIDFNQAHNFYCVYSERFVCPIPPKANALNVAVNAGEKMMH